jgi:large subunit ribosomal protein L6
MSRIGKNPVQVPAGVTVDIKSAQVTVKGPKGTLTQKIEDGVTVKMDNNTVVLERATDHKRHRALHGLYRSLIAGMVKGVSEGYKVEQELVGVGYRAAVQGNTLDLVLGYSHHVVFELPSEIKVATRQERGSNPIITMESFDKQLLGQVAAKIRSLRTPEPYKGKGIKFVGEVLRRKAGKSAAKK